MPVPARILVFLAGIAGALGVALSAAAAHLGGAGVETAATFLLLHAAALLGVAAVVGRGGEGGLSASGRIAFGGGLLMVLGLALFSGDLAARAFLDNRLFPMAAPTGGTLLIVAWVVVAVAALPRR